MKYLCTLWLGFDITVKDRSVITIELLVFTAVRQRYMCHYYWIIGVYSCQAKISVLLLPVLDFFCLQQLHKEIISIKTVNFWCLQLQAKISVVFIPVQYQLFVFTVERQRYQFYYYLVILNYVCLQQTLTNKDICAITIELFVLTAVWLRYQWHYYQYWIMCVYSSQTKMSVPLLLNYVC